MHLEHPQYAARRADSMQALRCWHGTIHRFNLREKQGSDADWGSQARSTSWRLILRITQRKGLRDSQTSSGMYPHNHTNSNLALTVHVDRGQKLRCLAQTPWQSLLVGGDDAGSFKVKAKSHLLQTLLAHSMTQLDLVARVKHQKSSAARADNLPP